MECGKGSTTCTVKHLSQAMRKYVMPYANNKGADQTWSETPEDTFSHDEAHL